MEVAVLHLIVVVAVAVNSDVALSHTENRVMFDNIHTLFEELYSSAVEIFVLMLKSGNLIQSIIAVFKGVDFFGGTHCISRTRLSNVSQAENECCNRNKHQNKNRRSLEQQAEINLLAAEELITYICNCIANDNKYRCI